MDTVAQGNYSTNPIFAAWGGMSPCKTRGDCYAAALSDLQFPAFCGKVFGAPPPYSSGKFCRCDFGLAGDTCQLPTTSSTTRVIMSAILLLPAIYACGRAVHEAWSRDRPTLKTIRCVDVSLWTALLGSVGNILALMIPIACILEATNSAKVGDLVKLATFQFTFVVPATLVFVLASALVILVVWRRIADAVKACRVAPVKRKLSLVERKFAVVCMLLFATFSFLTGLGMFAELLALITLFYTTYACWLYREGASYTAVLKSMELSSNVPPAAPRHGEAAPRNHPLAIAQVATKQITVALFVVSLGAVAMVVSNAVFGRSMYVDGIDSDLVGFAIIHVGWTLVVLRCVAYIRRARAPASKTPVRGTISSVRSGRATTATTTQDQQVVQIDIPGVGNVVVEASTLEQTTATAETKTDRHDYLVDTIARV
jgi:hypothetical protein